MNPKELCAFVFRSKCWFWEFHPSIVWIGVFYIVFLDDRFYSISNNNRSTETSLYVRNLKQNYYITLGWVMPNYILYMIMMLLVCLPRVWKLLWMLHEYVTHYGYEAYDNVDKARTLYDFRPSVYTSLKRLHRNYGTMCMFVSLSRPTSSQKPASQLTGIQSTFSFSFIYNSLRSVSYASFERIKLLARHLNAIIMDDQC